MKEYILSIICIALFVSSLNLILPSGKTSRYVKSIICFVVSVCIFTPIIKNLNLSENSNASTNQIKLQEEYVNYFLSEKKESDYKKLEQILKNYGILYSNLKIEYSVVDKTEFNPTKIKIYLVKDFSSKDSFNNYSKDEILDEISFNLNVSKGNIYFYE